MAGQDITQVIPLGPAAVVFNGVNLGHTDENGAKATRKAVTVDAKVGKFGQSVVKTFYDGEAWEIEFVLQQTAFDILSGCFPLANVVTAAGGAKKLTFGNVSGTPITTGSLVLSSQTPGNSPLYDLTLAGAQPVGDFNPIYSGGKIMGWTVKFRGIVVDGGVDGAYMATFGDVSVTADAVAPTATVVPVDGASGIAAGVVVTWTASKALDPSTVNNKTVLLFRDSTGLAVAGTVALSANGLTITFTPSAPLTTGQKYDAVLVPNAIKGQNSVLLAGMESDFTIA